MSAFTSFGRRLGYQMTRGLLRERERHGQAAVDIVLAPPHQIAPSHQAPDRQQAGSSHSVEWLPMPAHTAEERIIAFMDRFCYVRSDYARQWARQQQDGSRETGWARVGKQHPDRCALTPAVIEAHLRGRITVGTYLLDADNRCQMVVLDHDDKRTLPEIDPATGKPRLIAEDGLVMLQDCRARFAQQGIPSALLESRRGGHLFVFFDEPVDARDARALAFIGLGAEEAWRMHQGQQAFEIYPKQDRRSERDGAVGSNIALALGVHLKDGQRHPFIDEHGATVAHTLSGQLAYLETIGRVPVRQILRARPWLYDELDRAMHPIKPRQPERPAEPILDRALPAAPLHAPPAWLRQPAGQESSQGRRPSLIAQWKVAVDCRDIVRAYGVELNENGVGRCPFHDDQRASFQAWADGWRCYAENRGGDALHFVMEQEGLTPKEALAYVRERFPVPGLAQREEDGRGRA